jgi:hypothetical protein
LKELSRLLGALDIHKVGVGKSSWLSRSPVDCNSHIDHVLDLAEQVVQVRIRHLIGHVSHKEGVRRLLHLGSGSLKPPVLHLVVQNQWAIHKLKAVLRLERGFRFLGGREGDPSEALGATKIIHSDAGVVDAELRKRALEVFGGQLEVEVADVQGVAGHGLGTVGTFAALAGSAIALGVSVSSGGIVVTSGGSVTSGGIAVTSGSSVASRNKGFGSVSGAGHLGGDFVAGGGGVVGQALGRLGSIFGDGLGGGTDG